MQNLWPPLATANQDSSQIDAELIQLASAVFATNDNVSLKLEQQKKTDLELDNLIAIVNETRNQISKLLVVKQGWHTEMKEMGDFELVAETINNDIQQIAAKFK